VQTIKALARGPWGSAEHTRGTWYAPLTEQHDVDRAVWFVLGRPGLFLNTVADTTLLPAVIDAAERFAAAPSGAEIDALLAEARMSPLFVS
jgi:hypothetical protein